MIKRIEITDGAKEMVVMLKNAFEDLLFYQAGGCCEGTQPQCLEKSAIFLRTADVCIGQVEGIDFWLDKDLFDYWKHAHFTLDVIEGFGVGGFSLEAPYGKTFVIRYRLFAEEELQNLEPVRYNTY